jgi:ribosomal protein S15P/S13E
VKAWGFLHWSADKKSLNQQKANETTSLQLCSKRGIPHVFNFVPRPYMILAHVRVHAPTAFLLDWMIVTLKKHLQRHKQWHHNDMRTTVCQLIPQIATRKAGNTL